MEIVTGYRGKEHITAYKTGDFQQGVVGREDYVLDVGSGLEVQLVSNNRLDIKDGSICMQGRHAVIHKNINDELIIENGAQGEKRIDLVVARYEKEVGSGVESIDTFVIKGTPSEEKPTVPECVTGDIRNGDLKHEMPLYEVELDGINVIEVRPVFKKIVNMQEIQKKIDELNSNTQKKINELNSKLIVETIELNEKVTLFRCGKHRVIQISNGSSDSQGVVTTLSEKDIPPRFIMFPCTFRGQSENYFLSIHSVTGQVRLFKGNNVLHTNAGNYLEANASWYVK